MQYKELIAYCEHDEAIAPLLEAVIEAATGLVNKTVQGIDEQLSTQAELQKLATTLGSLNTHLAASADNFAEPWFGDPGLVNDHSALAVWAGDLLFAIYSQRKR